jgi:prolyl oligopeptidase
LRSAVESTYPAWSLLAVDFKQYLQGDRHFETLFRPTARKRLAGTSATKNYLVVNELDNVKNRLYALQHKNGQWTRTALDTPAFGSVP